MALAGVKAAAKYLHLLLCDANERDQLSKDLLINVTGFFRDAAVFDFLAKSVIPDLVGDHPPDRLRQGAAQHPDRTPNGVGQPEFFEKQLASSAPDWLNRGGIPHKSQMTTYPIIDSATDSTT